eukprot:2178960-Amphidinium_carterae.1
MGAPHAVGISLPLMKTSRKELSTHLAVPSSLACTSVARSEHKSLKCADKVSCIKLPCSPLFSRLEVVTLK